MWRLICVVVSGKVTSFVVGCKFLKCVIPDCLPLEFHCSGFEVITFQEGMSWRMEGTIFEGTTLLDDLIYSRFLWKQFFEFVYEVC